jgi:hypothetical protein
MMSRMRALLVVVAGSAIVGCSDATGAPETVTLASIYHLKSIDGTRVPFTSVDGGVTDSGRVIRLGNDTVRVDLVRHTPAANGLPSTVVISFGTWRATQSGNVVVLSPLLASTVDTATLAGDTLTLRAHLGSGLVQTDVYVAP